MSSPTISVLLPVRNGGDWLATAVSSILQQTLPDLELLVIDDHSTDQALPALPRDDPRLRLLSNPSHGIVAALNYGLARAQGRFIARMDADDISYPERLERQLAFLHAHPEIAICGTQVRFIDADGTPNGVQDGFRLYADWLNSLTTPDSIAHEIYVESPIPHPSVLLRRQVLDQLGGYRERLWAEDYDLWLRAHQAGFRFGKPKGILLDWRDHHQRLSRTDPRCALSRFPAARAYYLARGPLLERPALIWGAGEAGALLCDALDDVGVPVQGFIDIDPRRLRGGRKRNRPVWPPQRVYGRGKALILVAVGARGARPGLRRKLNEMGLLEGRDYLFVA